MSYTEFVRKNIKKVRLSQNLTPQEAMSAVAKMWSGKGVVAMRSSPKRSPVRRRCRQSLVEACHDQGKVCSQNTSRTRCHYSPSVRRARARK